MFKLVSYPAPAKLNLFLHITSRRADGYHCLQTIFQFLDYSDLLHFEVHTDGQLLCHSTAKNLLPEQDIVLKAARLLQQFSATPLGATIHVEKRIPLGGGLGGGSSDAATTLLVLNKLWQLNLPLTSLTQLGLKLGADVPIFIHGHAAWAEGVGEIITPVDLEEPWYLVIHPNCAVPTAEIFNAPELPRAMESITFQDFLAGRSQNCCEHAVCQRYPAVTDALTWLNQYAPARLTGTGACIFAKFADHESAHSVLSQLPTSWAGFIALGKNVSPLFSGFTNESML